MAAANNRTLKEFATPDLDQQPLCIQYPNLKVAFELKSGLIHLLPTFHGFTGEDPNKHLKEFDVVCSSIRPNEVIEEKIKLRAFPTLCTTKRKLKGNKVMFVGENCSAILQKKLPPKLKDLSSFTIPCTIGNTSW